MAKPHPESAAVGPGGLCGIGLFAGFSPGRGVFWDQVPAGSVYDWGNGGAGSLCGDGREQFGLYSGVELHFDRGYRFSPPGVLVSGPFLLAA